MKRCIHFPFIRLFIVLFAMITLSGLLSAQVTGIGGITSWKKTEDGLEGKTESAYFSIKVYNESIIRVRVSRERESDDFSYVLIPWKNDKSIKFSVRENGQSVSVITEMIEMEIEKKPSFRITFRNRQGMIINEDVPGEGFGTSFIGERFTVYKKMQPGERFVGLGEVLGDLDKRGNIFTLNNTDTYRYGDPRLSMYASIPFYIGILDREAYGIFYHNTYKTLFNFGISTPDFSSVTSEGGDADYFFIYDSSIEKILFHYTSLTGRIPLPPVWSLGYHQSRCSYYPQERVKLLADTFRAKHIPIDCIVLDADYLQDYEPFRINVQRFPDMPGLTGYLGKLDIEVTASVNPGIKVDTTYFAHHDGLEKDIFLKFSDGSLYTAEIAPSLNNFVDFTNPAAREWWIEKMKFLPDNGIHGYWNDMNEPAVGGSYLPDNLIFDFDGRKANALEAKNLYGMLMARSSYESAVRYGGNRRPFVLTRSGFAGVQRYAAVWSGDNTARDEYILGGVLLNTQMGLSGLPFVGDDIGGYIGNTSKELFIRWIQTGAFSPYMRNHKEAFAAENEPWSYGVEAEAIAKEFIGFRYRLMPYLYSLAYRSSVSGMPIVRSLCIYYPFDEKVYDRLYQYQFMFGDALLIIPVTSAEKTKKIYLPEGVWYNLFTDEALAGARELTKECPTHEIPVYVRASSVIPVQTLVQSTKQDRGDTLFIHIFKGEETGTFEYYEDDGSTLDYINGVYFKRKITYSQDKRQVQLAAAEGSYRSCYKIIQCIFHGFEDEVKKVEVNGQAVNLLTTKTRLLDGLRYLDDIYDSAYYSSLKEKEKPRDQLAFSFINTEGEITVKWQ